jgi:hypothetical protein
MLLIRKAQSQGYKVQVSSLYLNPSLRQHRNNGFHAVNPHKPVDYGHVRIVLTTISV